MLDVYNPDWDHPLLDQCAMAVGRLCNAWAWMEGNICGLTAAILKAENDGISETLTRAFSMQDQYNAIKMAAVAYHSDDGWVNPITSTVNYVQNTLGPRRNRFVHDLWTVEGESLKRVDFTPAIAKAQSRQPKSLRWGTVNDNTLDEIAVLTEEIKTHGFFTFQILSDLSWPPLPPLARLLEEQPPQRLAPPQTEKPGQREQA